MERPKNNTPAPNADPHRAQETDPASGMSDDPRVDATPDGRHSATEHVEQPTAPDS